MSRGKLRDILTIFGLYWKKPYCLTFDDWDEYEANRKWLEKTVDFISTYASLYRLKQGWLFPRKFLKNIKQFFIWGWRLRLFRPWDYSYMYQALEYCFRDMEEYARVYGHLVASPRQAKEYSICAEVCRRMVDKSVADYRKRIKFFESKASTVTNATFTENAINTQLDILTGLMRRKSQSWWD